MLVRLFVCLLVSLNHFNAVLLQIVCRERKSGREKILQIGHCGANI